MARFRMQAAFHFGSVRVKAGGTIADSLANSLPGDAVYTGLTAATVPYGAVALDGGASTMLAASRWAGVGFGQPTGRDSVD
jgi:hypothetical protein